MTSLIDMAYSEWRYKAKENIKKRDPLVGAATKLYEARPQPSRLSPLVFMTDPSRVDNVLSAIQKLPRGATVIYRHFGKTDRLAEAEALRQLTFEKGQQFLIGHDPELAIKTGADGVHFRRDSALADPALWRQRCPDWLITMAGLKTGSYTGNLAVLDGLFISSIFESQSPSAGQPIGIEALKTQVQTLSVPVFALGGINAKTAGALAGSGAAGLAALSGFRT